MDDLISRQAAIEAVEQLHGGCITEDVKNFVRYQLWGVPSAEKQGKWIRPMDATESSYRYQCSECGETAYQVTGNCGRKYKVKHPPCTYKFCPNCGADMRGERNATD